jgi:precorrin-6B methylase 2
MKTLLFAAALLVGAGAIYANADSTTQADVAVETRQPDVIFVPTPPQVVEAMLQMAKVRDGDILYDLGSGDGRIPIAAVKAFKLKKAVGIDIDPQRIKEARANAEAAGVADKVTFRQEDLFKADFSDASVITLYLLDSLNEKLRPRLLAELKPGTRIVSHAFRMGDWAPEQSRDVDGNMIYMWTVPPRK